MGQTPGGIITWDARGLPANALDAASEFSSEHLPKLRALGQQSAHILLDPADHTHDSWRAAMIGELAREAAPGRINAIVGSDAEAIRQIAAYLDSAYGVTGQIFTAA